MSDPTNPTDPYGQRPEGAANGSTSAQGGYGQPAPGYGQPNGQQGYSQMPPPPQFGGPVGGPTGTPPKNYLVWAILSTLFCCTPLGIAAIVFAAKVNSKWAQGDYAGAEESSRKAKTFAMWATIIGAITNIIVFILNLTGVLNGAATANHTGAFGTYLLGM